MYFAFINTRTITKDLANAIIIQIDVIKLGFFALIVK